jgi:hypothetical protein
MVVGISKHILAPLHMPFTGKIGNVRLRWRCAM